MAAIKRFEDIHAWQQARQLVREVYSLAAGGPLKNDPALRNQITRAAVSAMSNVAEGFAKKGDRDFAHFLDTARGSAVEVRSLLYVARDVGYITHTDFERLYGTAQDTIALIGGFTSYLRKNSHRALQTSDSGRRTSDGGQRTPD